MNARGMHRFRRMGIVGVALVATIALFGLAGCGGEESSTSSGEVDAKYADLPQTTLVFADGAAKGAAGSLWAQEVAGNVNEITGGKLVVDYHGNGDLGGDADLIRQVQSNDIQMIDLQPAVMVSFVPELAAMDLPMAFATYSGDQIETVLNGDNEFTQKLQASYESAGFHNMGWLQNATYRETTANRSLQTLADYQGLQIRTMENSNHMAFWSAVGADPTPLAFSEVYFALQNGTVDAQENAVDTCVGSSFQEVQKCLAMTNHILYANNIVISKECWESLDPAYQKALTEAIAKATETMRPQLSQMDEDNIKVFKDAGVEVVEYDDSFFNEVLALDGVKQLYSDIESQTNGLSALMVAELEKTKE